MRGHGLVQLVKPPVLSQESPLSAGPRVAHWIALWQRPPPCTLQILKRRTEFPPLFTRAYAILSCTSCLDRGQGYFQRLPFVMTVDFTAKDLKRVFPTAKFVHLTIIWGWGTWPLGQRRRPRGPTVHQCLGKTTVTAWPPHTPTSVRGQDEALGL